MFASQLSVLNLKKHSADSFQQSANYFFTTDFNREANIFFTSSLSWEISSNVALEIYPKSFARINWYSSSDAEPNAKFKNLPNWGSEFLPQPSAIFVGIEDEDLLIWLISPYNSSFGNSLVELYIIKVSECDFSQTNKSRKFFMVLDWLRIAESCQLKTDCSLVRPPKTNFLTTKLT